MVYWKFYCSSASNRILLPFTVVVKCTFCHNVDSDGGEGAKTDNRFHCNDQSNSYAVNAAWSWVLIIWNINSTICTCSCGWLLMAFNTTYSSVSSFGQAYFE